MDSPAMETPWERYCRRQSGLHVLQAAVVAKKKELQDELEEAQRLCPKHIDDGRMFEGACVKCMKLLG